MFLISPQSVLDLTMTSPDYITTLLQGGVLDRDSIAYTLHNRKPLITDIDRERLYSRNGTAKQVVDDPAQSTWTQGFSLDDEATNEKLEPIQRVLRRQLPIADGWNRLYGMGCLVLGFNDGRNFAAPVGKATTITWAHAFSRRHIFQIIFDQDKLSPTFGQPQHYLIRAGRPGGPPTGQASLIHADRLLPLVERPMMHPIVGGSALDPVWNDLEDRSSIGWASSEAFYQNASPKFVLKTQRPLTQAQEQQVDQQMSQIRSNVRDVTKMLASMELVPLTKGGDIAKPLEHIIANTLLISDATGMPFSRFFKYHLTSGDALDWANREWFNYISHRQQSFALPVIETLMDRLAKAGIITIEQAQSKVEFSPPGVQTRDDIAKTVRNEAIGLGSAAKVGYVPKDVMKHYEKAPSDMVIPQPAGPNGPNDTGEKGTAAEGKEMASTKNLSRGKPKTPAKKGT
jgi:hypothetical protein